MKHSLPSKIAGSLVAKICGNPFRYTLEHRIFNLMLFLAILLAAWGAGYNFMLDLPMGTKLLLPFIIVIFVAIYYYSRFRRFYSVWLIYPMVLVTLGIGGYFFFINDGSGGPMVLLFLSFFNLLFLLTNLKHQFLNLLLLLTGVILFYYLEWVHPGWVTPYPTSHFKFWDHIITFWFAAVFMASGTMLFKGYYNHEQKMLQLKNAELKSRNEIIREQANLLAQKTSSLETALDELKGKNETIQTLMKELNHRVGNNLQLIYSLLNMQESEVKDEKARQHLSQARNRILAISLLHQKLFKSESAPYIDLPGYIRELCGYLVQNTIPPVKIECSFDPLSFPSHLKASIHFGLIINEIITNSLKYAWLPDQNDRQIQLQVDLSGENRLHVVLSDNGTGFSPAYSDPSGSHFGLHFIQSLLQQYAGTILLNNNAGCQVEISMTLPEIQENVPYG